MRLEEHTDFSTLAWVKPEIDELLNQARHSLEAYVDDTADQSSMQACAGCLHQVAGTLQMVESYGATQLTGEMEGLARALLADKVTDRDNAYGALMRGLVQLPDYLDLIDVGRKDLAIVLMPLLNELRAARGAAPADESVVFHPTLEMALPADVGGARALLPFADLRQRTLQIRARLQPLLVAWAQGGAADYPAMAECIEGLLAISHSDPARRLWWVAGGVLEALRQGRLEAHAASVCRQFAQLERVVQQMGDQGEEACNETDAREVLRLLLFTVANVAPGKGRSEEIIRVFRLDQIAPTAEELDHARAAMSGRNRALLDTVAKAVREDLLRVKEALDIFLRRDRRDPSELAPYVDALRRVGDTLSVLGLAASARSIAEQRDTVADIVEGKREGRPEVILDVASSLLYVDASLDMHIEALGSETQEDSSSTALPVAEARRIMRALLREAGANLAKVKTDITAFIESGWAHESLANVPRLLGEVSGALRILNLEPPAEVVEGIDRYIGNELLGDRRVPTVEEMDALADALAGVEYYLEIGRDASTSDERILDAARRSLERLHYWPVPAARAAQAAPAGEAVPERAPPPSAEASSEGASPSAAEAPLQSHAEPVEAGVAGVAPVVPGVGPGKWVDVEEEVLEPITDDQAAVDTSFQDAAGIDEEIREVFVEEVAEEISNINTNLPVWRAHPEDLDALKNLRRSFHTLKGSGRLVGAMALGEFSWKVENMLNRVLDQTIQPDSHVQELVEVAVATLPKLEAGLKGEEVAIDPPLAAIMQAADKLAAGEPARVADFTQGYRTVTRTVRRWVPAEHVAVEAATPVPFTAPVGGLPVVDPILLDVLRTEVAQHVAGMREYIARNASYDVPADDDLVRAVHTLHGAIGMVGIEALDSVLAPTEVWIRRVRSAGMPLDREGSDALRDTAALTEHVLAQFDSPAPDLPDTTALAERIHGLRDSWPEAAAMGGATHPAAEEAEQERLAAEQAEQERAAAEQAEQERAASEEAEQERLAAEHAEQERAAAEQAAQERAAAEEAEQERAAAEQAAQERAAAEQAEAELLAAEQAEQERVAAEQAEQERIAAEQAEAERVAAEQAEQERIAAEQAEQERIAAEQAEQERIAAEHAEAERLAAEQAEQERIAAEQAAAEQLAAEQAEEARLAAEQAEQERLAAAEAERQRIAARRREAELQLAKEALPPFPEDRQPEGSLDASLDAELVGLFTEEGNELLDESDGLLATLHGAPDDADAIHGLQRNLHTLKGGARVVGLAAVGDLAHAMETLLEKTGDRASMLAPVEMDALERGFDRLHDLVARVERGEAVAAPVNAIERFNALAEGRPVVAAAEIPAAPDAVEPPVEALPVAEAAAPELVAVEAGVDAGREVLPAPPPRQAPTFAENEVRVPSELIRVRSDLLDSMVNAAGEVSIYRARLEQQVSSFRFNLVELDQTVARLREQLRKLEIETETQILSRYQRENEGSEGATFDPLELDRFSNLQQYSRALAESVSDLASIQDILDDQTRQSETLLLQQSRVNTDLQDGLMRTRMVPFESLVPNLRRTVRGAADELGKRAQLRVEGAQGEMDRNVLERMKAPFEHMLRNALTHGIEAPAQRIAVGKPAEGTVTIQVGREGTEVLVDVSDDGTGFNRAAIREKAIQRGLLKPDAKVSDNELLNFVLETGFSTAGEVSQLAGRGVGMDVVANEVRELGGSLSIESEEGKGTTFHIRLPFTLAVTQAITVRASDATFAVPMTSIHAASRIHRQEMEQRVASGDMTITHVGEEYKLHDLSQLLGLPSTHMVEDSAGHLPLLLVHQGDLRAAIRVDVVIGSREIVVKPVGPQISNVPGIFGATIMGDGSVMLILDLAPLVRRFIAKQAELAEREAQGAEAIEPAAPAPAEAAERTGPRLVMVVDDSITMRKVTTRVLERELMEVVTAKDGVDALEKLQDRVPDVMLLDIEMPRMDGYELATHMKNDARFRGIPIIMITSRTGEKHRQRAFEIGVDRYLGKPYSEADLLRNVAELLEPVNA